MCNVDCTQAQHWTITTLEQVVMYGLDRRDHANHYVALDAQGHPALLFAASGNRRQPIYEAGAFASYSLRLDQQERPRLVYFTGEVNGPREQRQLVSHQPAYLAWAWLECRPGIG